MNPGELPAVFLAITLESLGKSLCIVPFLARKTNWVIHLRSGYVMISPRGAASHEGKSEQIVMRTITVKTPPFQSAVRLFFRANPRRPI